MCSPGLRAVLLGAVAIIAMISAAIGPVAAQGFLQRLFGVEPPAAETPAPAAPATPPALPQRQAAAPPGSATTAPATDALTLLVIGDFMARGLSQGLEATFENEPRITLVERINGSSGLVRNDFYDWAAELPAILTEIEPDFVVFMIGTNDRQDMQLAGNAARLRSEAWDREYAARVDAIAAILAEYGRPALWVGQPPMRQRSMSADMAFFNTLYEAAIERIGGIYVDVWDGFADAEGRFTATGPDVDGQTRTLRADDGFSFTSAGRVKLAFYVDREIRIPGSGELATFLASPTTGARVEVLPDGTEQTVGPVIVFGEPPPGAPTELLDQPTAATPDSMQFRVFVRGDTIPAAPGRVDDFSWPRAPRVTAATVGIDPVHGP
ncbi:MAG: DUF459 domain-containing protein [Bauldia sp.]